LTCGASLLDGVFRAPGTTHATVLDHARRRCAGAIFPLHFSFGTSLASSVLADLVRWLRYYGLGLYRLGRRFLTRSVFADWPAKVGLDRC